MVLLEARHVKLEGAYDDQTTLPAAVQRQIPQALAARLLGSYARRTARGDSDLAMHRVRPRQLEVHPLPGTIA